MQEIPLAAYYANGHFLYVVVILLMVDSVMFPIQESDCGDRLYQNTKISLIELGICWNIQNAVWRANLIA